MVTDLVRPRICSVPAAYDTSLGRDAIEFARRHGMTLDPEQEFMLESAYGVRESGRWQSMAVGINVPRQNGKGEMLIARELHGLFELEEPYIVHTAHEFKTSERHFARVEEVIRNSPELLAQVARAPSGRIIGFRYSHGDEAIELQDGRKMEFRTRTKSGMRGFENVSCLVLDEAMILNDFAHSNMLPTVRASDAKRGPQIWYTGSAADQMQHDHAVVWTRLRERGMAGKDSRITYLEWSLDFEHPDDVPDEVICDPVYWRMVNFAIERGRVHQEHMEFELDSMSRRGFCVELLGVGDYPPTDLSSDILITSEMWDAVLDPEAVLVDPIVLSLDISPEGHSSVVAAGRSDRGDLMVEVVSSNHGTGWLEGKLQQLYQRHEVEEVVCDGYGPASAVAKRVDEAGITVKRLDAGDYGTACGLFVDSVRERTIRHLGQPELNEALRGAKARPLVDRWAWSRTKSTVNISPLVAATLALYSAVENDVGGKVEIFI